MTRCFLLAATAVAATLSAVAPVHAQPMRDVFVYEPAQQISLYRPSRLIVGTHSEVRGIRWQDWGSRRSVGRGRLFVRGGVQGVPAVLVASAPAECPSVSRAFIYASLTLSAPSTALRTAQLFHAPMSSACYFGD